MRHLIPKQMRVNGVKENEVVVEESAVRDIIRYYTREAGVRSLERAVGKILRKIVLTELEAPKDKRPTELPIRVTAETLEKYLGVRRFSITSAQREPQVGIVNGLSWSEVGGDILMIEAVAFPGKGQVLRTGMLGDVMKESVEGPAVWCARVPNSWVLSLTSLPIPTGTSTSPKVLFRRMVRVRVRLSLQR